jgi:hypothetical protein
VNEQDFKNAFELASKVHQEMEEAIGPGKNGDDVPNLVIRRGNNATMQYALAFAYKAWVDGVGSGPTLSWES